LNFLCSREQQSTLAYTDTLCDLCAAWQNARMAQTHKSSHKQNSERGIVDGQTSADNHEQIDPREFGLFKAVYGIREAVDALSIGRTSLYSAINRGELRAVKFGKKTLFYAADLAIFLAKLKSGELRSGTHGQRRR
jgi:excisionase family DNA binding protein